MVIGPDITRSLLSGPLSAIATTVNSAITSANSVQNSLISKFAGVASNLIAQPQILRPPFSAPPPFQLPGSAFQNLNQSIQNLTQTINGMNQNMQQALGMLGQLLGGGFQQPTSPFNPSPLQSGFERFLEKGIQQFGDRAANLTGEAMNLQHESSELRQARSLVDQATPLLLTNNPFDQIRGEQLLAKAKSLASENPQLGALLDQAKTLSRSSNPVDRFKAHQILSKTENRMTSEANCDSSRAQLKLGQASQMLNRMSQYSSVLFSMQQHSYASFR